MKRCDKCVYWVINNHQRQELHEDEWRGKCHRHAPSPLVGDVAYEILRHLTVLAGRKNRKEETEFDDWEEAGEAYCSWPVTTAEDWCGDFQAKAVM